MSLDHRVHVVHCDCEGVPVNDWGSHGRSRDAQLLQQTLPAEASGGGGNLLGLWSKARVEGWRGSAEKEARRIKDSEPLASGQGARASSLQQHRTFTL